MGVHRGRKWSGEQNGEHRSPVSTGGLNIRGSFFKSLFLAEKLESASAPIAMRTLRCLETHCNIEGVSLAAAVCDLLWNKGCWGLSSLYCWVTGNI